MSTIQKIAKNTLILIIANMISLGLALVINIYMARYLSEADFGMIFAALNLATLFTVGTDLGVSTYLTIRLSSNPGELKPYLDNALSIKFVLGVIAFLGILSIALLTPFTGVKFLVVMTIGLYVILTAISQVFQSVFQSAQSMEHMAVVQLLNPVILVIGTFYVIWSGMGVVAFALIYLASGLAILAYNLVVTMKFYHRPMPALNAKLWKALILGGLPLSLSATFTFIYYRIDVQLISFISGEIAVGNYGAAYKLIDAVTCIPAMYSTAIFPVISYHFHENSPYLHVLLVKSVKYLSIIGIPICIGTFVLADKFIYLLYAGKFYDSIYVLQALSLGLLLVFINYVPTTMLAATNLQKTFMIINGISAIFNIALNLIVIPVYGIVGSAYTMVFTQAIMGMMTFYVLSRQGYRMPDLRNMAKVTACAIIMSVYVYMIRDWNLLFVVVSAAALYSALILVSRSFERDDMELLSGVLVKKEKISQLAGE